MKKGSGTRSGLLWEVERLLNETENLPQILLMENVPQVISADNIDDFHSWCSFLESKGYKCYTQILNAKDYGVAQNRERCFMVSILGDYNYKFPQPVPLDKTMKDYLEDEVDEKYYIKEYYNQFAVKKEEKTMKVIIGSARRDENGKYAGGKPGDQDGVEVSTQNYYVHTKGWYMFRFLSDEHAKKVAKAMWDACMNNNIGYCQAHRSIMAMLKKYGSMKAIGEKTETDCSDLVRGCIYEATGIDVGAFSTATEPSVLEKSGLFAKKVSVTSATVLKSGDILVTKSKGHTVIVVSVGGSAPNGSTSTSKPAMSGSTARVESARSKDAAIAGKYKTTSNLYLRVGAGTGKTAITLMPAGSSVQCYGYYTTYNGTRWYYVVYGDKTGFCSSAYLQKA